MHFNQELKLVFYLVTLLPLKGTNSLISPLEKSLFPHEHIFPFISSDHVCPSVSSDSFQSNPDLTTTLISPFLISPVITKISFLVKILLLMETQILMMMLIVHLNLLYLKKFTLVTYTNPLIGQLRLLLFLHLMLIPKPFLLSIHLVLHLMFNLSLKLFPLMCILFYRLLLSLMHPLRFLEGLLGFHTNLLTCIIIIAIKSLVHLHMLFHQFLRKLLLILSMIFCLTLTFPTL